MEFLNELVDNHQGFLVATMSGITAIFVAMMTSWVARRRGKADTAKQLTDIALSLIQPMEEEIGDLKKELRHLDREVVKLKAENQMLHRWSQLLFSQVVELGSDPIPLSRAQELSE